MIESLQIPDKESFKINEVCGLVGIKPYVLRFWESEFVEIDPSTGAKGEKLYSQNDIEAIALIKKFLFEDKMTIERARREISRIHKAYANRPGPLPLKKSKEIKEKVESEESLERPITQINVANLVMAKRKLESMLSIAEGLKKTHNWN